GDRDQLTTPSDPRFTQLPSHTYAQIQQAKRGGGRPGRRRRGGAAAPGGPAGADVTQDVGRPGKTPAAVAAPRPDLDASPVATGPGWPQLVVLVAVALNLRPTLASVPPVLDTTQADLGLSATGGGLRAALPVVCMGVFAPVGAALARRVGREAAVACALAL